jgi:hypothetical protein
MRAARTATSALEGIGMRGGIAVILLAVSLAACDQQNGASNTAQHPATQLDSPAPDSQPSRVFAPSSDAARAATGQLTVTIATRLPDAGAANADAQEVLTLHGANGLNIDGQITSAISPATQVQGQTLRALFSLPVEESDVLVYRVSAETKTSAGQGLCGANATAYVVMWEPSGPGDTQMKIMGVSGGAPGAASARSCPVLDYQQS